MKRVAGRGAALACLVGGLLLADGVVNAQQAPTAGEIAEQLKPLPRTRSMRNLTVEARERPSISLSIHFDFDSARIRPESQQTLQNLAQALRSTELGGSRFAVEGHTDGQGSTDYNLRLSQRRADAVRDVLVAQGVEAGRLLPAGKGASELALPHDPHAALNRRVRVVNLD